MLSLTDRIAREMCDAKRRDLIQMQQRVSVTDQWIDRLRASNVKARAECQRLAAEIATDEAALRASSASQIDVFG